MKQNSQLLNPVYLNFVVFLLLMFLGLCARSSGGHYDVTAHTSLEGLLSAPLEFGVDHVGGGGKLHCWSLADYVNSCLAPESEGHISVKSGLRGGT